MSTPLEVTADELEDLAVALRVAANCFEMSALAFTPHEDELTEVTFAQARKAMRRQASRFRKLAQRLPEPAVDIVALGPQASD